MSRVSGVAERIRLQVLSGELAPGRRVVEVHLAARMRVGRSTLREALRHLEGDGLLVSDPSGGMHVVALDEADLAATLEVRAALEGLAAGLAARRVAGGAVAGEALEAIEPLLERGEADLQADRQVHRALAALGANRLCQDALRPVWDRIVLAGAHGLAAARPAPGHRELLAAIAAGDEEEASTLARRHALAGAASAAH